MMSVEAIAAFVGCVLTLLGFIGGLISAISKLTSTITVVSKSLERMEEDFKAKNERNSHTHQRIFTELDEHKDILDDHELRLKLIEKEGN